MRINIFNIITAGLLTLLAISCNNQPVINRYGEPDDPDPASENEWRGIKGTHNGGFGSIYQEYKRNSPPEGYENIKRELFLSAWRGERINLQLLFWNDSGSEECDIITGELTTEDFSIPPASINTMIVKYVLTDEYMDGCGERNKDLIPAHLVPDILETGNHLIQTEMETRPVWITVDIPPDARPGIYTTNIKACYPVDTITCKVTITVSDLLLPPPSEWQFCLDLEVNPYTIAKYHNVENWSQQHMELLKPYLSMLSLAGQKKINTRVNGSGKRGDNESMVTWIRNQDGSWEYDYSDFDQFVNLAMECGISEEIECYTGLPQNNIFRWFDESAGTFIEEEIDPLSAEFKARWASFLYSLRIHASENGWLDITTISVDPGSKEEISNFTSLILSTTPEIPLTITGEYYPGLKGNIRNYNIPIYRLPSDITMAAGKNNRNSGNNLFYTDCGVSRPNTFTFSSPAEASFLPLVASAYMLDGYKGMGFNNWTENPFTDSRVNNLPAGAGYLIYPGPVSSKRFELLRDGIEEYEKITILHRLLSDDPSVAAASAEKKLEHFLNSISVESFSTMSAAEIVSEGKILADSISAIVAR